MRPFDEKQIFEARIAFRSQETAAERESVIHYRSANPERDAWLWWQNRIRAWPEHFHRLYAVKVFTFDPQWLDADGGLRQARNAHVFEWKCDWGAPIEHYIERNEVRRRPGSSEATK